jgi:hypothetical protein
MMNMTKFLAGTLIVIAATVVGGSQGGASRDLWIGVISDNFTWERGGRSAAAPHAALEPVAALVNGTWLFEPDVNATQPALPTQWQARLFGGRRETLRTSGPPRATGYFDRLMLTTDLALAPLDLPESPTRGVAFAGGADLHVFGDLPEHQRD